MMMNLALAALITFTVNFWLMWGDRQMGYCNAYDPAIVNYGRDWATP